MRKPQLTINTSEFKPTETKPTEKDKFNTTYTFITKKIESGNADNSELQQKLIHIPDNLEKINPDILNGYDKPQSLVIRDPGRDQGRALSTKCLHAIIHYYTNAENSVGIKTFTIARESQRESQIDYAPLKEGDIEGKIETSMENCKYKIAREILIQYYARSAECKDIVVPAIHEIGCYHNYEANNEQNKIISTTYYVKMDHLTGVHPTKGMFDDIKQRLKCIYDKTNIQHRDVKPENFIIVGETQIGIIDWGESTCDTAKFESYFPQFDLVGNGGDKTRRRNKKQNKTRRCDKQTRRQNKKQNKTRRQNKKQNKTRRQNKKQNETPSQ